MIDSRKYIHIEESSVENLIVIYKEAEKTSIEQINNHFDYLNKLVSDKRFHMIIDLSNTSPPSAKIRYLLKNRFEEVHAQIIDVNVYVGKNFLLKIAMKFVGASIGIPNFKTFDSIEQAIKHIESEN